MHSKMANDPQEKTHAGEAGPKSPCSCSIGPQEHQTEICTAHIPATQANSVASGALQGQNPRRSLVVLTQAHWGYRGRVQTTCCSQQSSPFLQAHFLISLWGQDFKDYTRLRECLQQSPLIMDTLQNGPLLHHSRVWVWLLWQCQESADKESCN